MIIVRIINVKTEQVLLGSLLGDGRLHMPPRGITPHYKEMHSLSQKEYLIWKNRFLKGKIGIGESPIHLATGKKYKYCLLWTRTRSDFLFYYNIAYRNGRKRVTKELLDRIGPLGLAVWFMDDGSLKYSTLSGKLSTEGFSYSENKLIVNWFKERWDIYPSINRDKEKYNIYFNSVEIKKFLLLIRKFVPECMIYKLGPLHKSNIEKIKIARARLNEQYGKRYKDIMLNPKLHARYKELHVRAQQKRLKNPLYRKKYNTYQKLYQQKKRKMLRNSNRAILLDRDGVINEARGLVTDVKDIKIIKNVPEAIKILNKDFLVIIITNQPQVARGLCTEAQVKKINAYVIKELEKKEAKIDSIFYCPHHPEKHSDTSKHTKKYRINCECRKPKIGMILKAKKKFSLDLKKCYFVGDTTVDIKAGKDAGCTTILLRTGYAGSDKKFRVKPDFVCDNLKEASKIIIDDSE